MKFFYQLWRRALLLTLLGLPGAIAAFAQPTNDPAIYVSDLDFGTFVKGVGGPRTLPLQVCNIGGGQLRFSKPGDPDPTHILEWLASTGYTVDTAEIAKLKDSVLGKNQCFTLHITFNPNTVPVGFYQVVARFWASTRDKRDTSVWTAQAVRPMAKLTSYDWNKQWVTAKAGANCTRNTVPFYAGIIHMGNSGTSPARVKSLELIGQDAADGYFQLDDGSRSTVIAPGDEVRPGDTLHQMLLFIPTTERIYSARARLVTETGDTIIAVLNGIGIESHITVRGATYDTAEFKWPYPYAPDETRWVHVAAAPTRRLTITGVELRGANAEDFIISNRDLLRLPIVLAPGESDSIRVDYRVQTSGERTAEIVFTGDHSRCDDSTAELRAYTYTLSGVTGGSGGDASALDIAAVPGARGVTSVRYALAAPGDLRIEIFDGLGRLVALLADGHAAAGKGSAVWDAAGAASGVYYCRATTHGASRTVGFVIER